MKGIQYFTAGGLLRQSWHRRGSGDVCGNRELELSSEISQTVSQTKFTEFMVVLSHKCKSIPQEKQPIERFKKCRVYRKIALEVQLILCFCEFCIPKFNHRAKLFEEVLEMQMLMVTYLPSMGKAFGFNTQPAKIKLN